MKRFLWFGHDDNKRTHGGGLDDLCGDFETLAETFGAIEADTSYFATWQILDTATGDVLSGERVDLTGLVPPVD